MKQDNKKFASKRQYKFSYGISVILLIFSIVCTIPAPVFIVLDIIIGFMVYIFRNIVKNHDIEKEKFKNIQKTDAISSNYGEVTSSIVNCPKCGSTSIELQSKKLSLGRAVAGNIIAGPLGATIGAVISKKNYCVAELRS